MKSIHAVIFVAVVWFLAGAFYYPKWNKTGSEALISWDASGYYHYLPAIFIYKDLRHQDWMAAINERYLPSPAYDQAFDHIDSGNKVNKYAIGQAVMFAPFFLAAHSFATLTDSYPPDGYSFPYQLSIWIGGLVFSIFGLALLRKILMRYYNDRIVLWTILTIGIATNLFEYASITNAMNHNWLFTLLCLLIYSTIHFYNRPHWISAAGIGMSLGLGILTRPTEIIWVLIPLLWGIGSLNERWKFIRKNGGKVILAAVITALIISIQAIYWKYASGDWVVYSYRDQGFNWFNPKIWRGLFGVRIGWWAYTPVMLIAMFGWFGLYRKNRGIFWPTFLVSVLAIYITVSWSHFEGAGGLGQRNLIQMYPLMAFPLAAIISWFWRNNTGKIVWVVLFMLNVYYNLWWSHQAHKGGFFLGGQTTTPYFYNVVGRLKPDRDLLKLVDTREYFKGTPEDIRLIYRNDRISDHPCQIDLPNGSRQACLDKYFQNFGPVELPVSSSCGDWIRLEGQFTLLTREWDPWKQTQWVLQFFHKGELVKSNLIRIHRLLPEEGKTQHLFFDVRLPRDSFDRCEMSLWNGGSDKTLAFQNLKASCFKI